MRSARLLLALSFVTVAASACHAESVEADFTGIELSVRFPLSLRVESLEASGRLDDQSEAFAPTRRSVEATTATTGIGRARFPLILPASLAGERVLVRVDGLESTENVVATGTASVDLLLGVIRTASVTLAHP